MWLFTSVGPQLWLVYIICLLHIVIAIWRGIFGWNGRAKWQEFKLAWIAGRKNWFKRDQLGAVNVWSKQKIKREPGFLPIKKQGLVMGGIGYGGLGLCLTKCLIGQMTLLLWSWHKCSLKWSSLGRLATVAQSPPHQKDVFVLKNGQFPSSFSLFFLSNTVSNVQ